MITVRFPSGFSIQYNDARYTHRGAEHSLIYESSDKKKLFAIAPNSCVMEYEAPCRLYNPIDTYSDEAAIEIKALRKEMASLARKIGRKP